MRLRDLESALGDVGGFREPVAELEQYPTSAHLASRMLHVAASRGDVEGCAVLDMGCGGGVLGVGAALLGAGLVVGVDVDDAALTVAAENAADAGVSDALDFVRADVMSLARPSGLRGVLGQFDTVVMNPPFGTKRKGIDICFLMVGVQHATGAVYSLHKTSTREFIRKKALQWQTQPEVLAQMRFDIPAMYSFHRQGSVDVEVDLWRLDCSGRSDASLPDPRTFVAEIASVPARSRAKHAGRRGRGHGKGR